MCGRRRGRAAAVRRVGRRRRGGAHARPAARVATELGEAAVIALDGRAHALAGAAFRSLVAHAAAAAVVVSACRGGELLAKWTYRASECKKERMWGRTTVANGAHSYCGGSVYLSLSWGNALSPARNASDLLRAFLLACWTGEGGFEGERVKCMKVCMWRGGDGSFRPLRFSTDDNGFARWLIRRGRFAQPTRPTGYLLKHIVLTTDRSIGRRFSATLREGRYNARGDLFGSVVTTRINGTKIEASIESVLIFCKQLPI